MLGRVSVAPFFMLAAFSNEQVGNTVSTLCWACLRGRGTGAGGIIAACQVSGEVGGPLGSRGQPRLRAFEYSAPPYCVIAAALHTKSTRAQERRVFANLRHYILSPQLNWQNWSLSNSRQSD